MIQFENPLNRKTPDLKIEQTSPLQTLFSKYKKKITKKPVVTKTKKLTAEEKYWAEVNQLAQEKLHHLFTTNIPFQNIPLITEPWKFEDRQQKLSGLFLRRDVDYRTVSVDLENQWYERTEEEGEELPTADTMAEEVALWYSRLVMKALLADLKDYAGYDPSLFSGLTTSEY